jgi:cytochrome P450
MSVESFLMGPYVAPVAVPAGIVPRGPSTAFFIRNVRALSDPHRILGVFEEIARRWGPICSTRSGLRGRTYIVADYAAGDEIFRRHDNFTKYPHHTADLAKLQAMIGKGMLATHTDEEWASHRGSMARSFSRGTSARRFSTIVRNHVEDLIGESADRGDHVSNISELAMRLSGRVMSDILAPGHPLADDNFLRIKRLLDQAILDFHRWDYRRRVRPYRRRLREQAQFLIASAAENPGGDGLIARMMQDEPDWRQSREAHLRLLDRTLNLVVAGYETTATTLNWIVHYLASHRDIQDRLRREVLDGGYGDGTQPAAFDDRSLLQRTLAEVMRLHSVLWFNIRYVTAETVIQGVRFVPGSRVMLLPFLANRSVQEYSQPEAFRPDRYLEGEPGPLFPFGNGQRVCIGRTIAQLEMQAFVVALLGSFRLEAASAPKAIGGVLLQPSCDVEVRLSPLLMK